MNKKEQIKAMEYIKKANHYRCGDCQVGFLRLKKVRCPFCKSKNIKED